MTEEMTSLSHAKALQEFDENGKALLELAENESKEGSLQDYIKQKIRIERNQSLLGLIPAGAKFLSVKKKKDAEGLWKSGYRCAVLRDTVEDFLQLGVQWDAFLEKLDSELHLGGTVLGQVTQTSYLSADILLTDAKTGETLTLGKYFGKGVKVLLVLIRQFACLLCRLHLKDLEDSQIYSTFGLGASLKKVLNFDNMLLYAEYVVANLEFPRGLPSVEDDMFQLGGDFLLDEHGRVLFSHRCESPIDRPPVEHILAAIDNQDVSSSSQR